MTLGGDPFFCICTLSSDHRRRSCIFDSGVFGFLPICTSKGETFMTLCGVILCVFIISATSEANLYDVFDLSIFITANLRLIV